VIAFIEPYHFVANYFPVCCASHVGGILTYSALLLGSKGQKNSVNIFKSKFSCGTNSLGLSDKLNWDSQQCILYKGDTKHIFSYFVSSSFNINVKIYVNLI
jgi:hypothetical protein